MPVPDLIGRYRLGPRVGSGGFATVWLARDESLDVPIAIKIMAEHWADRMDLRERFLSEARMLRRASSSRVVQVFDIGELPDGRPYFVMEYADRGTLAERIGTGPLPLPQALRLAAEVARGAAELHRAGIVHRDIKPSNVLLASGPQPGPQPGLHPGPPGGAGEHPGSERVLIADLGVAKSLAQGSGLTMSVGSAGYMAPEQAEPNTGVDVRADVYSVGAVGYRMITGAVPGSPGQVLPAEQLRPGLPPDVRRVLARAMDPDPARRWPDAASLADRFEELAAAAERALGGRRTRIVLVATVLAVLLAAGGAGFAFWDRSATVPVHDPQGPIDLRVPRAWAQELKKGGWDPEVLGLSGAHAPGLVVATRAGRWSDLSADVDGVFAGLSTDRGLAAAVLAIPHPGCRDGGTRTYRSVRWTGQIHRWEACGGGGSGSSSDGGIVEEVGLTSLTSPAQQAYVQIRSPDGRQAGPILDSLTIGS